MNVFGPITLYAPLTTGHPLGLPEAPKVRPRVAAVKGADTAQSPNVTGRERSETPLSATSRRAEEDEADDTSKEPDIEAQRQQAHRAILDQLAERHIGDGPHMLEGPQTRPPASVAPGYAAFIGPKSNAKTP